MKKSVAEQIGALWGEYYRSQPFVGGDYLVEILRVHLLDLSFFVVECRILQSTNPLLAAGRFAEWTVLLKPSSLGSIREFVSAAGGVPESEVDETAMDFVVSAENPLAGEKARVECTRGETLEGRAFTRIKWVAP